MPIENYPNISFDAVRESSPLRQEVSRLRTELATTKETLVACESLRQQYMESVGLAGVKLTEALQRAETAERQRDAMAAALERALRLGREMAGFVKSYGLDDYGPQSEYSRWSQCRSGLDNEADPTAILAARDADQRRKGAAWALKQTISHVASNYERERFEAMLVAIESGEVEVPNE